MTKTIDQFTAAKIANGEFFGGLETEVFAKVRAFCQLNFS